MKSGITRIFAAGVPGPAAAWHTLPVAAVLLAQLGRRSQEIYNVLWILVFGFATLNILSLVTKRYEPHKNRMSVGEVIAIMTVVVAVFLLGWEMLYLFNILPLKLPTR
jgi:hypothetical protein